MNFAILRHLPDELLEALGIEKLYESDGRAFHAFPERWHGMIPWGTVVDDIDSTLAVFDPLKYPKDEVGIGEGLMRFGITVDSQRSMC